MRHDRIGRAFAGVSAAGFVATAALHSTGYPPVARAAAHVQGLLGAAIPALWLMFSLNLLVLGLVVGAMAARPGRAARLVLGFAGLCPLGAAGLQIYFIGFVAPTAILLAVGVTTIVAAVIGLGSQAARAGETD